MKKKKGNPVQAANRLPGSDSKSNVSENKLCPTCPLCSNWLLEFEELCNRYASMGITPDIASLTLVECWGLYCWLKGLGV